jgi:hypothetical protein
LEAKHCVFGWEIFQLISGGIFTLKTAAGVLFPWKPRLRRPANPEDRFWQTHPLRLTHWGKHIGGQSVTNEIAIDPQSCKDQRPLGRSRW